MTERNSDVMEAVAETEAPSAEPFEPVANGVAPQPIEEASAEEANALLPPPEPGPANLSPDGATLAYLQADADGALALCLVPLDGGEPRKLETSVALLLDEDGPQWSPDGATLALAGAHPDDGRSAIWLVAAENGEARLLVDHPGEDRSPRWAPDGGYVAFVSRRDGRDAIAAAPAEGGGPAVQLTHAPLGQDDRHPAWAPDGNRIAFARRTVENEQSGDHVWWVNVETGETKQVTKRLANRRSLSWAPDRALILHVTDDGDWENVAVVNPDNSAGWNVASEPGNKSEPSWSQDGGRVLYTRLKDGVVRLCERATSSASAELVDPGDGMVRSPRWLPDKRVVYAYAPATGAARFIVQEPKADAARTELPRAAEWSTELPLVTPSHVELAIEGRKIGGLMYRREGLEEAIPAVILLADRPDRPRAARFDAIAQALAAEGLAVFAPSLPGTAGYGKKTLNALKEAAGTEAEVFDLIGVVRALGELEGIARGRIAVAGRGHGGTLAMLLAGSRPGTVQAVAAVDPIADWDVEFDHADAAQRAWLTANLGLPATNLGAYALRTPATFAGVIDVPLLLLGTDRAPAGRAAQLEVFAAVMREIGLAFDHESTGGESEWQTGQRLAAFLRRALDAVEVAPEPESEPEPATEDAEALVAEAV